jgi:predicted glycosyltransferase
VLVVGDEAVFDVGQAYAFPPATRAKLHYCGYINRANPGHVARPFDPLARKSVLVHAGGGADGIAVMDGVLSALELLGEDREFDCRMIGGPELGGVQRFPGVPLACLA